MTSPAAMLGMGGSALGGVFSALGGQVTARGQQTAIQGQMLQTVGQAYQLETQAQGYEYASNIATYQAGVADVNAKIAQSNASYALDVGETAASEEGMKDRAAVSTMKASQGASGVDVNVGSSTNVRESMIELSQTNQAVIRANAAKVAYGYDVQAVEDESQRDLYTYTAAEDTVQASNALTAENMTEQAIPLQQQAWNLAGTAGDISSLGSLATGGASVASKWMQASSLGQV